jgi:hypothetical protein
VQRPARPGWPRRLRALTRVFPARSNETLSENLERKLSGLTRSSLRDVEALAPGSPIYLFNVNDKRMHGVFESVRRRAQRRRHNRRSRPSPGGGARALMPLLTRFSRAGGARRPEPGARGVDQLQRRQDSGRGQPVPGAGA